MFAQKNTPKPGGDDNLPASVGEMKGRISGTGLHDYAVAPLRWRCIWIFALRHWAPYRGYLNDRDEGNVMNRATGIHTR
jgi:hypothetical protein